MTKHEQSSGQTVREMVANLADTTFDKACAYRDGLVSADLADRQVDGYINKAEAAINAYIVSVLHHVKLDLEPDLYGHDWERLGQVIDAAIAAHKQKPSLVITCPKCMTSSLSSKPFIHQPGCPDEGTS